MLTTLGIDSVAETIYRAMLAHPQATVADLALLCGAPEAEVRDALDLLSELALVRPSAEGSGQLHAVSPRIGMEILMARQQAQVALQQERLAATRAAAAQLISAYTELRPTAGDPGVEQLVGVDRIQDRLASLTCDVEHEVMAFAPDGTQSAENMAASRPLNQRLLSRGVRMRTVYLDSARGHRPTLEHADWLAGLGGQVRTVPSLPTRMIVTDRGTAMIPVSTTNPAAGAVVLTGQGTLAALCALFDTVWEAAQPLGATPPLGEHGLTGQQAAAVKLLAEGLTDEAIAKRLAVSHRTARRIASELMERLGARSRFEAGARAAQRGWIDPSPS
ncbi:helix-turn-helix transcriptional regulator [Streptomyces sp. ODS05-4]|uniref:helix-turn-helix transcriptional regulator n=1 Tax=Streptomyces sp. ODS05-4 TaxID=2944939 RepID=UPI00210BB487|nr:helix-turn-helix transcriptional regulator [Streptomyces sp. ODS05-4]